MQIIIKLTTACNFACSYCSEGDQLQQTLSPELFYKLVDDLPALLDHCHADRADILWHGGEPLLYGCERLSQLMDYAREKLKNYDLSFLLQTNGYLIDDAWIACFKKYDIAPGISFDGLPELHDANRRTKEGKATAATVLENIKKLHAAELSSGLLMVLNTAKAIDSHALLKFIKENDLHPKIHPVVPCGRAAGEKASQEIYANYVRLLCEMYEECLQSGQELDISPLDVLITALLSGDKLSECSYNGTCGENFICLYPDGYVGFCGRDNATRCLTYGRIQDSNLLELYNSPNAQKIRARQAWLQSHSCRDCRYWRFCRGGCAYEAMNYYGTLEAPYPHCAGRKQLLDYLSTKGLELLKQRLLLEKREYREAIAAEEELLKEIRLYAKQ